jgi:riboflavin biosynthesis pyrimidine reductase
MQRVDLVNSPGLVEQHYGHRRSRHGSGRLAVELCMVTSLAGAVAVEGRSGPMSSPADRLVLATLRSAARLVLVGAGTVRAEDYRAPSDPGVRIAVVTRSGDLDWDGELFASGAAIIVTGDRTNVPGHLTTLRSTGHEPDLDRAIVQLGSLVPEAGFVHVEGGAALNGTLVSKGLLDAVNLTVAPMIAGGAEQRIITGAPAATTGLSLVHAFAQGDHLFTRWERPTPDR